MKKLTGNDKSEIFNHFFRLMRDWMEATEEIHKKHAYSDLEEAQKDLAQTYGAEKITNIRLEALEGIKSVYS